MAYVEYEADGKTIKARVQQKTDTLANWMANDMIIKAGEQAFVIDGGGTPINFKIGDGTKRFSELPWWISYDQGQYVQVVGNTLPTPTVELGYSFVGPGTYTHASGNVIAPDGRFSQIVFEGGAWSLKDMGALPTTPLTNTVNQDTDKGITPKGVDDALSPVIEDIENNSFNQVDFVEQYNPSTELSGFYNSSGVQTANTDFKSTPKIPVVTGQVWRYRGASVSNTITANRVLGFKADNSVVVLIPGGNTPDYVDFTIPSDIVNIVANYHPAALSYKNLLKQSSVKKFVALSKDSSGVVTGINGELLKFYDDTTVLSNKSTIDSNIFDQNTYTELYNAGTALNGYYNASGVQTANAEFKSTPKITVAVGDKYRYAGKSYGGAYTVNGVYGFKGDDSVVVLVAVVNTSGYVEFTIPTGVVSISANYYTTNGHSYSLQKVVSQKKFVALGKDTLGNVVSVNGESIVKKKTGKSICFLGNSITANGAIGQALKGYQQWLVEWFEFTAISNMAYPGKPFGTFVTPEGTTIIEQFINNAVARDVYILVCPATNDYRLGTRLGTFDDYKALTSYGSVGAVVSMNFYQSLKAFFIRCYQLNPKAKIILTTDLQRNNATWDNAGTPVPYDSRNPNPVGNYLKDFVDAVRKVAEYESIPVIDMWKDSGINLFNISQFTSDGLHPNADGYKLMADLIKPEIEKI